MDSDTFTHTDGDKTAMAGLLEGTKARLLICTFRHSPFCILVKGEVTPDAFAPASNTS